MLVLLLQLLLVFLLFCVHTHSFGGRQQQATRSSLVLRRLCAGQTNCGWFVCFYVNECASVVAQQNFGANCCCRAVLIKHSHGTTSAGSIDKSHINA